MRLWSWRWIIGGAVGSKLGLGSGWGSRILGLGGRADELHPRRVLEGVLGWSRRGGWGDGFGAADGDVWRWGNRRMLRVSNGVGEK